MGHYLAHVKKWVPQSRLFETMNQKRLRILTQDEIEALYARPHFAQEERHDYFLLTSAEREVLDQLRTAKSKLHFILSLGYFKAKHRFFRFDLAEASEDVAYVIKRYADIFSASFSPSTAGLDKKTALKQQRLILQLCHYHRCNDQHREQIHHKAQQAARVSGKPIYIFRSVWKLLEEQHVVAPGYTVIQNMVGQALHNEQKRLTRLLQKHLDESSKQELDRLLEGCKFNPS